MQINKSLMLKGCLIIATLVAVTACVDNKYDLTDIDTTSRITVNNLTVPINLEKITLDDVIDLDDNENISVIGDQYAIQKGGDFTTSDFRINGIHVDAPYIPTTNVQVPVALPTLGGTTLAEAISIPSIKLADLGIPAQDYNLDLANVDDALISLKDIKTKQPITVEVILEIPSSMMHDNSIAFNNLVVQMPVGLMVRDEELQSGVKYNEDGKLIINKLNVENNGKAVLQFNAYGLNLEGRGDIIDNRLNISGNVGIEGGTIDMSVKNVNIPNPFTLDIKYKISDFDIASFSGSVNYNMDNISIDPISLSDLPDFLDNPETKIVIANPEINVDVNNPVGTFGLIGEGHLKFVSNFADSNQTPVESEKFTVGAKGADLTFVDVNNKGASTSEIGVTNLCKILTNDNVGGLPKNIQVGIEGLRFYGDAVDFPIGESFGNAHGDYTFTAPLGFGKGTYIVYETTEDGWAGEDLDKLYINALSLTAFCSTDIPVGVTLRVYPLDKDGNEIPVDEDSGKFTINPYGHHDVELTVKGVNGQPIRNLDGIRFRAVIEQNSDSDKTAIGPDLYIELERIRITVDGYYETDF